MAEVEAGFVKICGISTPKAAEWAIESGASAIGFIFADSKRHVTAGQVRAILDAVDHQRVKKAGVFVNPDPNGLKDAIATSGINLVQLAGDESPDLLGHIEVEVWKVLRFGPRVSKVEASTELERWLDQPRAPSRIQIEAFVPGLYGGTGQIANWSLAQSLAESYPIILAGGLTPENVMEAVQTVRPTGVDTSGGVEVGGVKDRERIKAFVLAARSAFESSQASPSSSR